MPQFEVTLSLGTTRQVEADDEHEAIRIVKNTIRALEIMPHRPQAWDFKPVSLEVIYHLIGR